MTEETSTHGKWRNRFAICANSLISGVISPGGESVSSLEACQVDLVERLTDRPWRVQQIVEYETSQNVLTQDENSKILRELFRIISPERKEWHKGVDPNYLKLYEDPDKLGDLYTEVLVGDPKGSFEIKADICSLEECESRKLGLKLLSQNSLKIRRAASETPDEDVNPPEECVPPADPNPDVPPEQELADPKPAPFTEKAPVNPFLYTPHLRLGQPSVWDNYLKRLKEWQTRKEASEARMRDWHLRHGKPPPFTDKEPLNPMFITLGNRPVKLSVWDNYLKKKKEYEWRKSVWEGQMREWEEKSNSCYRE